MSIIVAIDGPAGAGKSTVARRVAQQLGFALVDTGAIYRSVALAARQRGIATTDDQALGALAGQVRIEFRFEGGRNHIFLDGADVTEAIRSPDMSRDASAVSARPPVRAALLDLQRRLGRSEPRGAVLEGRDIGTVVFPDADVKVFLTASAEARARRRFDELRAKGIDTSFESVLDDQVRRDHDDATRAVAPLRPADDARLVDSTGVSPDIVVDRIVSLVHDLSATRGTASR